MNSYPAAPAAQPPLPEHAYWFLFHQDELLLKQTPAGPAIPSAGDLQALPAPPAGAQYIGAWAASSCYVGTAPAEDLPPGFALQKLRGVYGLVAEESFRLAFRAFHIRTWLKNNRYCGCCGQPTQTVATELAVRCGRCGHTAYPRISPAIIVAVTREEQILLARSSRFPPGRYSVIAGFVEPGETLEDCVRRELREEVGVEVDRIEYFGNQPWPFPDSLMIAFTARCTSDAITIDNDEIVEAAWFSPHELPDLPGKESIARQLIDAFVAQHRR